VVHNFEVHSLSTQIRSFQSSLIDHITGQGIITPIHLRSVTPRVKVIVHFETRARLIKKTANLTHSYAHSTGLTL